MAVQTHEVTLALVAEKERHSGSICTLKTGSIAQATLIVRGHVGRSYRQPPGPLSRLDDQVV